MINNITNVDSQINLAVAKTKASTVSVSMPPIIGFKTPNLKQKAQIRIKKIKRSDNIVIVGDIDDDYVDIVEDNLIENAPEGEFNFFQLQPQKRKTAFLKNCYIIDYIQSPKQRCGLGTEAVKSLAEKAMFDSRAEGRIVTFSAAVWKESAPALFFYKLGFRFVEKGANEYMEECLIKKVPDIPPQIGMMYLPKSNLHRLLRYGELF